MSETRDDGGPAFPRRQLEGAFDPNSSRACAQSGMSLRDYFAAHAPKPHDAWISSTAASSNKTIDEVLARHAYAFADQMLKARTR